MKKLQHWKNVCKLHWKEIITLSIALHWMVDLLIIAPIVFALGYFFGVHVGHSN
tara:strand:- start:11289 stop:11450 length:162 start_codon:yes stop_codon:yes gene_type:complete